MSAPIFTSDEETDTRIAVKKLFSVAIVFISVVGSPVLSKEGEEPKFVRYVGDDKVGKLQTVVVSMKQGDVKVDLVGAVHIADKSYYAELTNLFKTYEALLFEGVGGESFGEKVNEKKEDAAEKDKDGAFKLIGGMMNGAAKYFNLQYQKDGIDYRTANFVHADVTMLQFKNLQKDKGETFFSVFQNSARAQIKKGRDKATEPTGGQLLLALLGDSSGLKASVARSLAGSGGSLEESMGEGGKETVIIAERNKVALATLEKQLAAGKKNIGIFYGAGHLADMQARMVKMGFERTGEKWMTAWDIKPLLSEPPNAEAGK
jgi:hypothetical protein